MRRSFIMLALITLTSNAFAVQVQCIGYCQTGSSAPTGKRATGTNYPAPLDALKSATTALYNTCPSPKVLSGIKCVEVGSKDNGLNASNYDSVTQAHASTPIIGGVRPARFTEPCHGGCGGGQSGGGGTTRKDSAY